ncbi:protein-L-isoaspartate(D-aspartate) O-methyltransferase [Fontivita pretiosa]|uniref:protein-L-isoaspartate(D-aspartate) O-methyltransferase n=1 Tax=Fontivita pretiosa TaxID=2989684 RepID=UPI003D1688CC
MQTRAEQLRHLHHWGKLTLTLAIAAALVVIFTPTRIRQPTQQPPPATLPSTAASASITTAAPTVPEGWPPNPPAGKQRVEERHRMVLTQIQRPSDGRDRVQDPSTLDAMRAAPRHAFVPRQLQDQAYQDSPLPIGHGQTISQPYIVALMTEKLQLTPQSKVLEIGTGSGYQAAVLAHLTPHVYSIEIIQALADAARAALDEQGYSTVQTRRGDGYYGWEEAAPFDAIIVTAAAGHVPPPLWQQLAPGGRMVIPIGGPYEVQRLVVLTKQPDGSRKSQTVTAVRFVPMTGQIQRERG